MVEATFRPRFNHVAISVDAAVLDETGRAELLGFFNEVFGWTEGDNTGESGNPLILYTGSPYQFLYLLPGTEYLVAPPLDHFGLEVSTVGELEDLVERARQFQKRDARVRIIEVDQRVTRGPTDDFTLTNAYIGFLIPLMVELQHIERRRRVEVGQGT